MKVNWKVNCDWCLTDGGQYRDARYIVVTGLLTEMRTEEFFICSPCADLLCVHNHSEKVRIADHEFDEWTLHWITEAAYEFHRQRTRDRIAGSVKRSVAKARYPSGGIPA